MILGVDHITLAVSNVAQSADFYIAMLNMRPADEAADAYTSQTYWLNFGLYQSLILQYNPNATPNLLGVEPDWDQNPHLALTVTEKTLTDVEKQLAALQIECKREPHSLFFCDPDGNFLELTCWREKKIINSQ